MREILCAYLRQWAIDRFLRKRRLGHDVGCASAHQPLVLVKKVATRQVIMAASREAQAHGICAEMTLAEACALCPNLEHGEYQPREDRKGLIGLARWMMRFSPVVALDPSDDPAADPTPAIFVDVSGCERLYGSLESLLKQVDQALKRFDLKIFRVLFQFHRETQREAGEARKKSGVERGEIQNRRPISFGSQRTLDPVSREGACRCLPPYS